MRCHFSRNLDFRNHQGAASLRLNFAAAVELSETHPDISANSREKSRK